MKIADIYESLKGSRLFHGQLKIDDFTDQDYEDLWEVLIKEVVAPKLNGEDYFHWLGRKAYSYYRLRKKTKYKGNYPNINDAPDFYDELTQTAPQSLSIRQQLAIIKYFTYRQTHSWYVKH